jgi:heterogeneous nuclear ribonucleoprotein F/H
MQFFAGFAVVPSSFQTGSDHSGRPSGEGWITFSSAAEAERAVAQRNREYLGARYLELTLV